jgi:hypothetical protein
VLRLGQVPECESLVQTLVDEPGVEQPQTLGADRGLLVVQQTGVVAGPDEMPFELGEDSVLVRQEVQVLVVLRNVA